MKQTCRIGNIILLKIRKVIVLIQKWGSKKSNGSNLPEEIINGYILPMAEQFSLIEAILLIIPFCFSQPNYTYKILKPEIGLEIASLKHLKRPRNQISSQMQDKLLKYAVMPDRVKKYNR